MNRSILIVICDFLLLSLLTFSTDITKVAGGRAQQAPKPEPATNQADSTKDLAAVMRLALIEERKSRDQLLGELTKSQQAAERQAALLSEHEKQVQSFQLEIQSREQQALNLQREQTNIEQRFAAAQTNIQALNQQLQSSSTEATISKEKLAAMEAEARKQAEQAAALQQQLEQLAKSNQMVLTERQQLAAQLQVAEVEKRHAADQAARMREEVKVEREEKAKLAEGVKALASKSGELTQEIRENRPLTPNTIFNEFATNRVHTRFDASRPALLGNESTKRKDAEAVLATDGTNIFALCHVQDTPLSLGNPGADWEGLTGTLGRNTAQFAIGSLSFGWPDPRVVLMPVTATEAGQLGGKVYRISSDPYKFQDAVLVGAREGYYGECRFEIDLTTPGYVKLDNNFLKGLFGKFNPSRGDLVFSKSGELLGIMANSTYCLMIRNFNVVATFRFGTDVRIEHTGQILSRLNSFVVGLPFKLQ